jgi:hypothetical protein
LKDGEKVVTIREEKAQMLWEFYSGLLGSREERVCSLILAALDL